jgi:hypothetical protein
MYVSNPQTHPAFPTNITCAMLLLDLLQFTSF